MSHLFERQIDDRPGTAARIYRAPRIAAAVANPRVMWIRFPLTPATCAAHRNARKIEDFGMIRATIVIACLSACLLGDATAVAALARDSCEVATADHRSPMRALRRLRAAHAYRRAHPIIQIDDESVAQPSSDGLPVALELAPAEALPMLDSEAEVWPQASALFPAQ